MATAAYRTAATAVSPADDVLEALELMPPAGATDPADPETPVTPVRIVNAKKGLTIGAGMDAATYAGVRFEVRWPDQTEDRLPRAAITVDNVGRALTQWIERTRGLVGGRVKLMRVRRSEAGGVATATVEQSVTLDVGGAVIDQQRVRIELGYGLDLHRSVVGLRFDPRTAPGLFATPVAGD